MIVSYVSLDITFQMLFLFHHHHHHHHHQDSLNYGLIWCSPSINLYPPFLLISCRNSIQCLLRVKYSFCKYRDWSGCDHKSMCKTIQVKLHIKQCYCMQTVHTTAIYIYIYIYSEVAKLGIFKDNNKRFCYE